MQKKAMQISRILLMLFIVFFVSGCSWTKAGPSAELLANEPREVSHAETERLVVNGQEIHSDYVSIDHLNFNAHIPVVTVYKALGYDAQLHYDTEKNVYRVIVENATLLDTSKEDFGLPISYGMGGCIRQVVEDDIIVDTESLLTRMYWEWQASISIDYKESTIYIDTVDAYTYNAYAYTTESGTLIVNGKDITGNDPIVFRKFAHYTDAELPFITTAKELGAKVRYFASYVIIQSEKGSYTINTAERDYGLVFSPCIVTSVREADGKELILDSLSAEIVLQTMFDIIVTIDSDNNVVYIETENASK